MDPALWNQNVIDSGVGISLFWLNGIGIGINSTWPCSAGIGIGINYSFSERNRNRFQSAGIKHKCGNEQEKKFLSRTRVLDEFYIFRLEVVNL